MYCQKCGYKLEEGDKFCQQCGNKIENSDESKVGNNKDEPPRIIMKEEKVENVTPNKKSNKGKKSMIIGVALLAFIVLGIGFLFSGKSIDLSIQEYLDLQMNGQLVEYEGYELNIKGYLYRDTRENSNESDGYYGLTNVSDVINMQEDFGLILFTYDGEIGEDAGSGTEVIVTAKMQEESDTLLASNVEIINKVEPIYTVELATILQNPEKYHGKKVMFAGRMIDVFGQGQAVVDMSADNALIIDGLTEKEFAEFVQEGSIGTIVGTFENREGYPVIIIEDVKRDNQFDYYADLVARSVNDCYNDYFLFDGDEVSIYGTYYTNFSFSNPTVLCDLNNSQFISLTTTMGVNLDNYLVSGKNYILSGVIREGGTGFILEVEGIG